MFPQNNPNPGSAVTGNDDEFSQFVRQTIQEEIARGQQTQQTQNNPGTPSPAPQATPIQVQLNGQTFSFQNSDELNRALSNTFSAYNQQIAQLQTQATQPKGQEVSGQDDEQKIDLNQFIEKLGTDPVAAFEYVDEHRFGTKNPSKVLREAVEKISQTEQVLAAYQFKDTHPHFPTNPQSAQALYSIMQQRGFPATAEGMDAAYSVGVMNGVFPHPQLMQQQQQPPQQYQQQYQNPYAVPEPQMFQQNPYSGVHPSQFNGGINFNPQTNPYLAPPPRAPRAVSDAAPSPFDMADDLSPEQIEAVFRRLQQ